MIRSCSICNNLSSEVLRYNLKPKCAYNKKKFKKRKQIDYVNDKDLNSNSCYLFERAKG